MNRNKGGNIISLVLALSLFFGMTVSASNWGKSQQERQLSSLKVGEFEWSEELEAGNPGIEAEPIPEQIEEREEDSEEVRVFIIMEGDSILEQGFSVREISEDLHAQSSSQETEEKQRMVMEQVQRAVRYQPVEIRYQFSLLANAVSATVQYGDIERIKNVEGVKAVYEVPKYHLQDTVVKPNTYTAGEMVGSYDVWDSGYTGAGRRIAILDTGIDEDHPSFDPGAFAYGQKITEKTTGREVQKEELLDIQDISKVFERLKISQLQDGITPETLYRNQKIAFAFNYAGGNLDISHECGDHGTHVAGIAAANEYVPKENEGYQEQPEGVAGIAKDAQILVMKVFGDEADAYTDDYMAAIEDALLLDADVVNLSLGSIQPGESEEPGDEYVNGVFRRLLDSDMVVSISAGNAGAWGDSSSQGLNRTEDVNLDMVGNPGSFTNALTVASAINAGYSETGVQIGKRIYFYEEATAKNPIASMATLDKTGSGTEYQYVFLDSFGEETDYQEVDVRGKIVFVKKGVITFDEKHENAEKAGAIALFICDSDMIFPKLKLTGAKASIPCAMLGREDSWDIELEEEKTIRILSKPISNRKAAKGYQMSDFSSWGVPGDLSLKPEITAPGENIYSAIDGGAYGGMSGTSMAAPSISGMSALISEYIERNKLEEKTGLSQRSLIQSLLMSTAIPLKKNDKVEYSPRKQGGGFANVKSAISTPVYLLIGEKEGNDGKVKVELGDDPGRSGVYEFSFHDCNLSGKNQYYALDSAILTEQELDGEWILKSSRRLHPEVEFSSESLVLMYDLNGDKKVDLDDAHVLLQHINESAYQERVESNQGKFDFNGDGIVDTADVYGFLQELEQPLDRLGETVLEVKESAEISVKVVLSQEDREYLDTNFENGMYIDGFVYLNGKVDLSVPMLAFYGNWTESSMFEPFDYLKYHNGGDSEELFTYSGIDITNYVHYYSVAEDSVFCYGSNLYLEEGDQKYLPDRNAFSTSSGDRIESMDYTLIRNAAIVETTISNEQTGEIYFQYQEEAMPGAYFDSEKMEWSNTQYRSVLGWEGKDKQKKPLPEGTKVRFTIKAVPEYYTDNLQKAADGAIFSVPITIDNTKPKLLKIQDAEPGMIRLTFEDNRYTAAVKMYERDRETLIESYGVNQEEPGVPFTITVKDPQKVFYVRLVDYAGNTSLYRVNRSGNVDVSVVDGIILSQSELKLVKNNQARLKAVVTPESILDDTVTWTSEDASVAVVDENGIVTGVNPGVTRIIATTNAKDAKGELLSATCQVIVEEISVNLHGILWEEEPYFCQINTGDLSQYTKLSKAQDNYYLAATELENQILAVAGVGYEAELYLVDPADGYRAVLNGTLDWCPSDLAYSPKTGMVFGIEKTCLRWFEAEDIDGIQGEFELDECTLGDKLVGITYVGYSDDPSYGPIEWFYLVSQAGQLFEMGYRIETREFFYEDICKTLGYSGISTGDEWEYNSLSFDPLSGYIFWSVYDGSESRKLYALSYHGFEADVPVTADFLGAFPKQVSWVTGLCSRNWQQEDSASVEEPANKE